MHSDKGRARGRLIWGPRLSLGLNFVSRNSRSQKGSILLWQVLKAASGEGGVPVWAGFDSSKPVRFVRCVILHNRLDLLIPSGSVAGLSGDRARCAPNGRVEQPVPVMPTLCRSVGIPRAHQHAPANDLSLQVVRASDVGAKQSLVPGAASESAASSTAATAAARA